MFVRTSARALLAGTVALAAPLARAQQPAPQVIAGGEVFAVISGGAVQVYAADGRPVQRLGGGDLDDRPPAATGTDPRERAFDLLGVPESQRDTQAAEDLLEDDASLAERRALAPGRRGLADPPAPALAAPAGSGLVALVAGGLFRIGGTGDIVRLGPAPAGVTGLAATGGRVPRLWLARGPELLTSTGGAWRTVARGERPIDHLVGSARGWLAWASGDVLTIAAADGLATAADPGGPARTFLAPARVRALAACAGDLLILADDGLHLAADVLEAPEGPRRIAGPLPGEGLACPGDGPGPWLLLGPGLLASSDRGRTWAARPDAPAVPLAGAGLTADRLWLLARTGALLALPLTEIPGITPNAAWTGGDGPPAARRPSFWSSLLPRLVMTASHTQQGPRHEQRLLAFAEFPLQPAPPPPMSPVPPPMLAPPPQIAPAGPDARCLPFIRARAVERALVDPARARSLVTRAGRSAWLPELRLRMERRLGRNESLDVKPAASGDALGLDTVDDVRYEVRATWDLPRLVFNPEEVAAHHQALRTAEMRRDVESLVNRLFFERRRLLLPHAPAATPAEQGERLLRLDELAAELDAVSGGAFSRCGTSAEAGSHP